MKLFQRSHALGLASTVLLAQAATPVSAQVVLEQSYNQVAQQAATALGEPTPAHMVPRVGPGARPQPTQPHLGSPQAPLTNLSAGQINALLKSPGVSSLVISAASLTGDVQIPRGRTLIADVSNGASLNIQGNLIDSGKLLFRTSNFSVLQATLNAENVHVSPGALIASLNNLSLNINATNNIVNAGTIFSAGNLSIAAGGNIVNALPTGVSAAQPVMQALNNVNIFAGGGSVTNTGLISSIGGGVNIAAATANQSFAPTNILSTLQASELSSDLIINNMKGTIEAISGNISAMATNGNLTLTGGDYLSQNLNLTAGKNAIADVGNVTGYVNAEACNIHVYADSDNLLVGTWNVTADPVIANTGNVALTDITTGGNPLVVVSGADITWTNGTTNLIDTTGPAGGNVYLIAGAKFSPSPYPSSMLPLPPVTISGASGTGGKIDFSGTAFNGIDTSASNSPGNGGNIEISAFKGSKAGSGSVLMPSGSSFTTSAQGVASSGHVFVIAGASNNVVASPSIDIGSINSSGGTGVGSSGLSGGHIIITTTQPNVSAKNPMVIDPTNGSIRQGGIIGGAIANSQIKVEDISTGGGQVYILAGLGIDIGTGINTNGDPGRPGGAVNLLANGSGKSPVLSDVLVAGSISTRGDTGFRSGAINILASNNIFVGGSIDTTADNEQAGAVFIAAGTPATEGLINLNGIVAAATGTGAASAGSVAVLSSGGCTTCAFTGEVTMNAPIDTTNSADSGDGGPVTISSPGPVSIDSIDTSNSSTLGGNGGSVFIASGKTTGTSIDVTNSITTSATGVGNQAGGVYLIGKSTVNQGTITQTQTGGTPANLQVKANFATTQPSIGGNEGGIDVTFSDTTVSTTFNPGGYLFINDQSGASKGATGIDVTVTNDKNVMIPLVSLSSTPITLLGDATSFSGIRTDMSDNASLMIFSPGGTNIGGPNAFLSTKSNADVPLKVVASNAGNIAISNSNSFFRPLNVGSAVASNGTISIGARGGLTIGQVVNGATPAKGNAITLDAIGFSDLDLTDSISSAAGVALMPTGGGNISEAVPSVIDAASLTIGNVNLVGAIGTPSNPLFPDVNRLTVITNPGTRASGASIDTVANMTVSFKVGGTMNLTGGNAIILDNSTGPNLAGDAVTFNVGSLQATKAGPTIQSPIYVITTSETQGIGTSTIPISIANLKGSTEPLLLFITAGPGDIFLSSPTTNDVRVTGPAVTADVYSLSSGGNIVLRVPSITTTGNLTLVSKAGIFADNTSVNLTSAAALNLVAGKQGIGIGGNTIGTISVGSPAFNIITGGSANLFANGPLTFAGASNVGKAINGTFTLFSQANNVNFANGGSLTAPIVGFTGTGTLTQTTAAAISITSNELSILDLTVGNATPLMFKGGNLRFDTPNSVNLLSANSVIFNGLSEASSLTLEVQKGNITQNVAPSPLAFQIPVVNLKITGSGNIGSSTDFLAISTGVGSNPTDLTAQALKGSVFIAGVPDLSTTDSTGLNVSNSSASTTFTLSSTSPVELVSPATTAISAGKSVSIKTPGALTTSGTAVNISSPAVTLNSDGSSGDTVILSNFGASTKAVNLTLAQSDDFNVEGPSLKLVGSSIGFTDSDIQIQSKTGPIEIGAGATLKANDGSNTSISLISFTNITQAAKGTALFAELINLEAGGATGSIGTKALPIGTSSGTGADLLLVTDSPADTFIANLGPVSILPITSPAAKNFTLTTTGTGSFSSIIVGLPLDATTVTLQSGNGGINLDGPITTTGTTTLRAGSNQSIAGTAVVTASDLVLTAVSGNIGFNGLPLLTTVSGSISANVATGKDGDVTINNIGNNAVLKNSSAGGGFTFANVGTLTVNSITTRAPLNVATGTIFISTTGAGANLKVADGAKISVSGGDAVLQNANVTGNIDIGKGAKISTLATEKPVGGGAVTIFVGPSSGSIIPGQTLPAGLSVGTVSGGGFYSLGQTTGSCVIVQGTGNVLNLIDQAIIFDTGAGSPQLITLRGGVVITADPIDLSKLNSPSPFAGATGSSTIQNQLSTISAPQFATAGSSKQPAISAVSAPASILRANTLSHAIVGTDINSSVGTISATDFNSRASLNSESGSVAGTRNTSKTNGLTPLSGRILHCEMTTEPVVRRAETQESIIFCEEDSKLSTANGAIHLSHGKALLLPKSKTKLHIGNTECWLEKGAAVIANVYDDYIELVNLSDGERGQIKIHHGSTEHVLEMGRAVVFGDLDNYSINLPARNIVRSPRMLTAHVSVPFLLSTPLARAFRSGTSKNDQQLFKQLLKSCAAFSILNSKVPYKAAL